MVEGVGGPRLAARPELVDALFASGEAPPAVVVFTDGWTSYGGSQFLNSPVTGRYHSYLCDEIVPFIDARYRTLADRDHRALAGKCTGGCSFQQWSAEVSFEATDLPDEGDLLDLQSLGCDAGGGVGGCGCKVEEMFTTASAMEGRTQETRCARFSETQTTGSVSSNLS